MSPQTPTASLEGQEASGEISLLCSLGNRTLERSLTQTPMGAGGIPISWSLVHCCFPISFAFFQHIDCRLHLSDAEQGKALIFFCALRSLGCPS